ncbi:hypothetical protein G210_1742 [Candida maltosa Xu316]|uniref:Prokaryotic-type class I peptide chain release factors domain-containing protein n=1 Tax=Candida maltosa (strain Xu316) TaxID=1245528 RepID=M3J6V7_CANMX|nr:hypothetical protein G210_1742 [Candida maltosa Xu316]
MFLQRLSRLPLLSLPRFVPVRFNTTTSTPQFSEQEIENSKKWLETFTYSQIPTHVFHIAFSRASGPGGQKVNKTSSKATVSLEPGLWMSSQVCYWIPKPVQAQLKSKGVRYVTKHGGLLIQSDTSRNRDENVELCFKRLLEEIKSKVYFASETSEEDKEKWAQLEEDFKERKKFHKKKQSDKKKNRSMKLSIMAVNEPVTGAIQSVIKVIRTTVDEQLKNSTGDLLKQVSDDSIFTDGCQRLQDTIDKSNLDFKITIDETSLTDELKAETDAYNDKIDTKLKEFIISSAFKTFIQSKMENFDNKTENAEIFNSIALILDFEISLVINIDSTLKFVFYESIDQITKQLFSISTPAIENFWNYLESRLQLIKEKVYSKTPSERMTLLETFNYLTDKLIVKNEDGKRDTYKQDSFNDVFHSRVRFFLTNILEFEDMTGLNKYFLTSNTTTPGLQVNDRYLADVIEIQKLLKNPLYYLKRENHKQLAQMSEKISSVLKELIKEEEKFRTSFPLSDFFLILPPKSKEEQVYLKEKYSKLIYVPETYFASLFKGKDRKLEAEDYETMDALFGRSTVRMQHLLMIYIIAHLYSELSNTFKRQFLAVIRAPNNVKHFVDETVPPDIQKRFMNIKRDLFPQVKRFNTELAFIMQHIVISEKLWWGWILYGKDTKTGKSLFFEKFVTQEDLEQVESDFKGIYRFKEGKYFNNYVTPQVTRKMKTPRGLDRLSEMEQLSTEQVKKQINNIEFEINDLDDDADVKNQLSEKKSLLTWRLYRKERSANWLEASQDLREQMLSCQEEVPGLNEEEEEEDVSDSEIDNDYDKDEEMVDESSETKKRPLEDEEEEEKENSDNKKAKIEPEPTQADEVNGEIEEEQDNGDNKNAKIEPEPTQIDEENGEIEEESKQDNISGQVSDAEELPKEVPANENSEEVPANENSEEANNNPPEEANDNPPEEANDNPPEDTPKETEIDDNVDEETQEHVESPSLPDNE